MRRVSESLEGDDLTANPWQERMVAEHRSDYLAWRRGTTTAGRIYFVLGMHRSGTSCLTGCLEQCGIHVGDVQRRSVHQPRGNLEQEAVIAVNDAMLAATSSSWCAPPSSPVKSAGNSSSALRLIVDGLEDHAPAALKDPRLLFTIEPWMRAASRPAMVGTFRHPIAVATSLFERDRLPRDAGYRLWRQYNERLVELHQALGFPLLEFDLLDRDHYCATVTALAAELGLTPLSGSVHRVVDRAWSRTLVAPDAEVPPECADLYEYLRAHRYEGRLESGSFAAALVAYGAEIDPRRRLGVSDWIERKGSHGRRAVRRWIVAALEPVRRAVNGRGGR